MTPHDDASDAPTVGSGGGEGGGPSPPTDEWDGLRLGEQIGLGATGVVYRAWQESPRRWVAVKMLRSGCMATSLERERFEREARLLASLDDPNIVRVIGTGTWRGDVPYLVLELVDGQPLTAWLAEQRPSIRQRLDLFLDVCSAVTHAHQKPIIHRDLKPANVLVRDGRPKILDFGIARDLEMTGETGTGVFVGTLEWAAPEQVLDPRAVDTRTDIHALGLLLYFLLTGEHPRASARVSLEEMSTAVKDEDLPRPSSLVSTGKDLDVIVAKATAKEPAQRYQTADALRDDVDAYLHDRPIRAQKATLRYIGWKLVQRHPWRVALAGLFVGVAVAAVIGWVHALSETARANREAKEASEVAKYVVGFFEMSGADSAGRPIGDAWSLLDHAYRGISLRPAPHTDMSARLLLTMGRAYLAIGYADRASALAADAINVSRSEGGASTVRIAEALDLRAMSSLALGNVALARTEEEEAVATWEAELGAGSVEAARGRVHLARILEALGDVEGARITLEDVRRALEGRDEAQLVLADALESLALNRQRAGEVAIAVDLLRRALAIHEERSEESDPAQATVRLHLGQALLASGLPFEADPFLRESLGMRRRVLGVRSPAAAEVMAALAETCLAEGRLVEALLHAQDNRAILEAMHGDEHPATASAVDLLARIRQAEGEIDLAMALEAEARRMRRNLP